jgi:Fe2+ or Zn2+ uptake regulation protein
MRTTVSNFGGLKPLRDGLLLEAWERSSLAGDSARASALLSAACPETTPEQWDAVGLPEVILQLARLRQMSFGSGLTAHLPCSKCGSHLEFEIDLAQIIARLETLSGEATAEWTSGSDRFSMRTVNRQDLTEAGTQSDPEKARWLLLRRCTRINGRPVSDENGAAALRAAEARAEEAFTRLHQAAEITFHVACVNCGHSEETDLDMARFLWAEVRHRVGRLFHEVHELATAYGWSEEAVLNMPAHRRARYLEIIQS